jgi:trehalose/maltose hydrolase-like predicted phosphorylase
MARWNLLRGLDVAALMGERWPERWAMLSTRLGLSADELEGWRTTAAAMATGLDPKTGLFEQFQGYADLEPIDLSAYAGRSVPMDVVLGRERTQASQVVKQADVVALLALLPDEFPGDAAAVNFDHYAPRCGHGSSLSRALHGVAAARLGRSELALGYLRDTSAIDLGDSHVAIAGGVHIAALGGIWLVAVFGFAGLVVQSDGLSFTPRLPSGWTKLSFPVQWRGRDLLVTVDPVRNVLDATLRGGVAMVVSVGPNRRTLGVGASISIPLPA